MVTGPINNADILIFTTSFSIGIKVTGNTDTCKELELFHGQTVCSSHHCELRNDLTHVGDKYTGSWCKNQMSGEGTKAQADGSVIIGSFNHGHVNGHAAKQYQNGEKYVGDFTDDK
jgi:hypothetical protein